MTGRNATRLAWTLAALTVAIMVPAIAFLVLGLGTPPPEAVFGLSLLADKGLGTALASQARKAALPVSVEADGIGRYPQEAEAAVYFSCLEALQNIAKYAQATVATIRLSQANGALSFEVTDDGQGFDPDTAGHGSGLQGMADRLAALGGEFVLQTAPGQGTSIRGTVPLGAES